MNGDYKEFSIYWIKGENKASITLPSASSLGRKILRLAESHPGEVKIDKINDDDSIMAHVPVKYIKVSPPRNLTEEQRAAAKERLLAARVKKISEDD